MIAIRKSLLQAQQGFFCNTAAGQLLTEELREVTANLTTESMEVFTDVEDVFAAVDIFSLCAPVTNL